LNLHIDRTIQLKQNWPQLFPRRGDEVFLTRSRVYEVIQQAGITDECSQLSVGANIVTGAPTGLQKLSVEGTLRVGLTGNPTLCDNTNATGRGLWNGTNEGPNYVFIRTLDEDGFSPGAGGTNFIIEMSALNNTVFLNPSDFNFTFVDNQDGSYLLTYYASISGINLLSIYCNNRNGPIPGSPFRVPFLEIVPPVIVDARFTDKGNSIEVVFGRFENENDDSSFELSITNRADLFGHFNCDEILEPTIIGSPIDKWVGELGYCYWKDGSTLVILLGNDPEPVVGSTIGIKGQILRGEEPFQTNLAEELEGILVEPRNIPLPEIHINAPQMAYECILDGQQSGGTPTFRFDASSSMGTGGRPYTSSSWFVVGQADISSALNDVVNRVIPSSNTVVDVPSDLFEPDVTYEIGYRAVNIFGGEGEGVTKFTMASGNGLTVNIQGGDFMRVRYDILFSLPAVVENPCELNVTSFQWQWVGRNNFTQDFLDSSQANLETNVKNLIIPPRTMQSEQTYSFQVQYTAQIGSSTGASNTTIVATDDVDIFTIVGPIYAVVLGGDRRIDRRDAFYLDPNTSIDTSDTEGDFEFTWTCSRNTFPFIGQKCFDKPDLILDDIRVRVSGELLADGQYLFNLVATKGNRTDSVGVTIDIVETIEESEDFGVPFVVIDTLSTREWDVSQPLVLEALIDDPFFVDNVDSRPPPNSIVWSVEPQDFNMTLPETYILGPNTPLIMLKPNTLKAGINYKFTCTVTNDAGFGISTVEVRGDEPPFSGICSAIRLNTPSEDNELRTPQEEFVNRIHIQCEQFEDDFKQIGYTYQFEYISPTTGRTIPIFLDPVPVTSFDTWLPNSVDTITAKIFDSLGGFSEYVFEVETQPLVVPDDVNQLDIILKELVAPLALIGNVESVASGAFSVLEVLNAFIDVEFPDPDDPGFNITTITCCEVVNFTNPEQTDRRRIRHDLSDYVLKSFRETTITEESMKLHAQLIAALSTPSSDNDEGLMFNIQRYPNWFGSAFLGTGRINSETSMALLHFIWNQVTTMPFVTFSPGSHVRLAQAVSDFVNLYTISLSIGRLELMEQQRFKWKDISVVTDIFTIGDLISDADTRRFTTNNVTADIGIGLIDKISSQLGSDDTIETSWSLLVMNQNPYYYEQSSEGISSPVVYIQVVDFETSEPYSIDKLGEQEDWLRIQFPLKEPQNPFGRVVLEDSITCDWWFIPVDEQGSSAPTLNSRWLDETGTASCEYTNEIIDSSTGNSTFIANPECFCDHLTASEFALITELGGFEDESFDETISYGWWIFAGILGALLFAILILASIEGYRRYQAKQNEKDVNFTLPEPAMRDEFD